MNFLQIHSKSAEASLATTPVQVDLPVDKGVVLLDIGFCGDDPKHGKQKITSG
jgi:hypothetical protein